MKSPRPKKIRNLYLRYGDPPFVILSSFANAAQNQGWSSAEVKEIISEIHRHNYEYLFKTLKKYY